MRSLRRIAILTSTFHTPALWKSRGMTATQTIIGIASLVQIETTINCERQLYPKAPNIHYVIHPQTRHSPVIS